VSIHSACGYSWKDNRVTQSIPDPERLAALLDGRLSEAQRAELLDLLASSDDAFEAYLDAVAITEELEEAADEPGVIPLKQRARGRRWPDGRWLALAAMLVGIASIPLLWRGRGASDLRDPGQFVTLLEAERAGLPAGWNSRPWSTTRGAADPLTAQARAVRVGARLTDLELAVRARDAASTALLAAEIAALLEPVPASGPLAALYRDVGRRAGESPEQMEPLLAHGRGSTAHILGEDFVALGAWAEAALIASAHRDAGFFRSRTTKAVLNQTIEHASLDANVRGSVDRIQSTINAKGAPDWGALEAELTQLLRTLAK
jgi:hypothetical protein